MGGSLCFEVTNDQMCNLITPQVGRTCQCLTLSTEAHPEAQGCRQDQAESSQRPALPGASLSPAIEAGERLTTPGLEAGEVSRTTSLEEVEMVACGEAETRAGVEVEQVGVASSRCQA